MPKKRSLNTQDWVIAGFGALSAEGPQGIRVEAIARALKVSKGSFYWHFKDVTALKTAMLVHWVKAGTRDVIIQVEMDQHEARKQLMVLVEMSVGFDADNIGGVLAEAAIRDWARYYEPAAVALLAVDTERLGFVALLFERFGFDHELAQSHARLLYAGLIGMAHLTHQDLANMRVDMSAALALIMASKL